mgnify:FL=1|jgi:hypothetical protein
MQSEVIMSKILTRKSEMNRKTLQLLLFHYQDMHEGLKPCAEKSRFEKLIKQTTEQLNKTPFDRVYPNGATALEYAKQLAKKANLKNNKGVICK